jgi:VWFA-related protein
MMKDLTSPRLKQRCAASVWGVLAIALIGAGLVVAEEQGESPWATFFEPVEVPIVNVEVVVTDRDGKPVAGLTTEDFEVYEDGEPMAISNFYAAPGVSVQVNEEPDTDRSEAPDRPDTDLYLSFYIDENSIEPRQRDATLDHLREFLHEPLPPGVKAMLVRYDGSHEVRSDFTSSTETLFETLDTLPRSVRSDFSSQANMLLRDMQDAAAATILRSAAGGDSGRGVGASMDLMRARNADGFLPEIHAISRLYTVNTRESLFALQRFVGFMSGLSGRKGIVWVGGGLQSRMPEDLFRTWTSLFPTTAQREHINSTVEARQYDTSDEVAELIRHANAHDVSFFTLSSFATGAPMTVSPLLTTMSVSDTSGFVDMMSSDDALLAMSALTGGGQFAANRGIGQQIEEYSRNISSYYSLGYRPPTPGDGEYHKIRVNVRRDGVRLSHREGYRDGGGDDRMPDRTLAAAMLGVADNPMGIAVEAQQEEPRENGRYMVPVLVRIPIDKLVLLPEGPHHTATISLYTAVRDDAGRMSDVHGREYPVEVPNDELLRALEQQAGFVVGMVMKPGHKRVAVSVRDERSRVESTAIVDVEVGSRAEDGSG